MVDSFWFSSLSLRQKIWLFSAMAGIAGIVLVGLWMETVSLPAQKPSDFNPEMSIRDIAPQLGVTGKALARDLGLRLDVSKTKPLKKFGISEEALTHTTKHLLSHTHGTLKYYLYGAWVLAGLVFLLRLGRPDGLGIKARRRWYPRTPYIIALLLSVLIAGFVLGKSPNPMEGVVKVFKSLVGLYPDPLTKLAALAFFLALATVGNKLVCGWACPFGACQELLFSLPLFESIKAKKIRFIFSNTIRAALFVTMLLFLFGVLGGRTGTVIYHHINPFNLFDREFESWTISLTVVMALGGSLFVYRPFCQLICPFGLVSWMAERLSLSRVRIDRQRCTECGVCIRACPLEAAGGRVWGKRFPADCFSCGRCLNVCPTDAIRYEWVFKRLDSFK